MGDLVLEFQTRYPQYASLPARVDDGYLEVGLEDEKPLFRLGIYLEEWYVGFPEAHAHLDSLDEAMELADMFLKGEARTANEFRGEELAAAWVEVQDGEYFEQRHIASYLSPFDQEEWQLWPGENWRQVRVTRQFIDAARGIVKEEFERQSEQPTWGDSTLAMLEENLGPALEGMKWVVSESPRFVLQAPRGFRRLQRDPEIGFIDFAPPATDLVFRSRQFFRDTEFPSVQPKTTGVRPKSVEYERDEQEDENWDIHRWTLLFSDGDLEMMGIIELFYPKGEATKAEPLQKLIDASVSKALFVPEHWDVTQET